MTVSPCTYVGKHRNYKLTRRAPAVSTEQFETAFMKSLYEYGYRLGRAGYQWHKVPPGFLSAPSATAASEAVAQ